MRKFFEKIVEGGLLISGGVTSFTILLIVFFLFKEASGLFNSPVVEEGYVLAVNKSNDVSHLSPETIMDIFDAKITNWKEVGGPDAKIIVYSRETSSGTYEFFKESVLENKNYTNNILSMPATGAIIQSIRQTKGAIGYVGMAYLNPHVKAIKVSYDGGKSYAYPSIENARAKKYPIVRPLYYYYNKKDKNKVQPYLQFITSERAENISLKLGFIPAM